ncbi:MAG: hypothetical protein IT431_10500 [Phycisphaerales bacterium]|nr:hypothetical protein [Phycisphaerales bacterium]
MRGGVIAVGVGVVVLGGAAYLLVRAGSAGGGDATAAGGRVSVDQPGGGSGSGGGADAPGAAPMTDAALAELKAELAKAGPVESKSDEERLAEARAWVAANRAADRPYNEIEAEILALMDVMFDGEKKSPEWTMNQSQIEVEMIRSLDADGDGQVSDAEVQAFIDENIAGMFNPLEHPYLKAKLDTNGDGDLQPEEMMELSTMVGEGALSGVFDRAKLEAWDADNDGALSADERVAGEAAAIAKAQDTFGDMIASMAGPEGDEAANALLGDPSLSPEEQASARKALYEEVGEQTAQMLESQRQMLISQAASMDFMEAMRVDNLPTPDIKEMMSGMPQPPDAMAFDIDGDGQFAEDELAAQQQAMVDYQGAVARWGSEITAYRLKAQFENSVSQSDSNADGRLSPDEWDQRIGGLLNERDQRLYNRSYDLDGSGRVETGELVSYLEWYRTGSMRADINYDGKLDGRDLETMAGRYQSQGG